MLSCPTWCEAEDVLEKDGTVLLMSFVLAEHCEELLCLIDIAGVSWRLIWNDLFRCAAPATEGPGNNLSAFKLKRGIFLHVHHFYVQSYPAHLRYTALGHIRRCLNAFTDRSLCMLKSLPLLPQNAWREKSQTFSSDRVQEITVYISSCITRVSKLSGFGGSGGYNASNTI